MLWLGVIKNNEITVYFISQTPDRSAAYIMSNVGRNKASNRAAVDHHRVKMKIIDFIFLFLKEGISVFLQ